MAISSNRRPLSLFGRLAIAAVVWCGLGVGVAALLLVDLFRDHLEREADAGLQNGLLQLVALTQIGRDGGARLIGPLSDPRFARPFSGWAWQIRRDGRILAQSASLGPVTPRAPVLAAPRGGPGRFPGPLGAELRGLARAVAPRFTAERLDFAVAMPQAEIEGALDEFRRVATIAMLVLGLGQILSVAMVMRAGLRPLGQLRAKVAAMRAGLQAPSRPWPRELAPVAEELDALAIHVERLVERGRARAADLAHAVKTPLAVIRQHCEAWPEAAGAPVARQVERIRVSLDHHLRRSRGAGIGHGQVAVASCLEDLAIALGPDLSRRGLTLEQIVAPDTRFRGDEVDLYELLGNPLENACKWARTTIRVEAAAAGGRLRVAILDDGPGVPPDRRAGLFTRGARLDETAPGSGIGLSVVAGLVDLYGGSVRVGAARQGGLALYLDLPAA